LILNAHSYYSLRYGTLSIDELVAEARNYGVEALALTDINNSTGTIDFVKACKNVGIKPIGGMEFRRNEKLRYIGIAKNNKGFRELNEFYSHHSLNKIDLPDEPFDFNNVFVIWPFSDFPNRKLNENEFIGVRPVEAGRVFSSPYATDRSKLIVLNPVTFNSENGFLLHRNLRAIQKNTLFSMLTDADLARNDEVFRTHDQLRKDFESYPEIISNTR